MSKTNATREKNNSHKFDRLINKWNWILCNRGCLKLITQMITLTRSCRNCWKIATRFLGKSWKTRNNIFSWSGAWAWLGKLSFFGHDIMRWCDCVGEIFIDFLKHPYKTINTNGLNSGSLAWHIGYLFIQLVIGDWWLNFRYIQCLN